jgi:hypothetical protein
VCDCADMTSATAQFTLQEVTMYTNRVCRDYFTCRSFQFESSPPTCSSDRQCTTISQCKLYVQFETAPATYNTDRVCADIVPCPQQYYMTVPPTEYADRVCAPDSICPADEWEVHDWPAVSDRVCQQCHACASGELISDECTAYAGRTCAELSVCSSTEYEYDAPVESEDVNCRFVGMQTDRICSPLTVCESNNVTLHATGVGAVCEVDGVSFCSEPGSYGLCESCSSFSSIERRFNDGLFAGGAADCALLCFDTMCDFCPSAAPTEAPLPAVAPTTPTAPTLPASTVTTVYGLPPTSAITATTTRSVEHPTIKHTVYRYGVWVEGVW